MTIRTFEAMGTTASVPVQAIANANPIGVRKAINHDWLRDLVRSIDRTRLLVPILIDPSYQIVDGYYRFLAHQKLGKTAIPVIVAHDWQTVEDYFCYIRHLDKEGSPSLPMRWLELADLIYRILSPLYAPISKALARPRNSLEKTGGERLKHPRLWDRLMIMFEFTNFGQLRGVIELGSSIRTARKSNPQFADELEAAIAREEDSTGQLWSALMVTRKALHASETFTMPSDVKQATTQVGQIESMISVLNVVSKEATTLTQLNPAVTAEQAAALNKDIGVAVRRLNSLRRLLKRHAETQ